MQNNYSPVSCYDWMMERELAINRLEKIGGVASGLFIVNKPEGLTSHDVVHNMRGIFNTKKVGHAGTLDPFASGVLLIFVGKATKQSRYYIEYEKEYKATFCFGIETDSLDPEGSVNAYESRDYTKKISDEDVELLNQIREQYVPVFSSVRAGQEKLRNLARQYHRFRIKEKDNNRIVEFVNKDNMVLREVPLPKRHIDIKIKSISKEVSDVVTKKFSGELVRFEPKLKLEGEKLLVHESLESVPEDMHCGVLAIEISCSTGTFIRSLSKQIAEVLYESDIPACTLSLIRTQVGQFNIEESLSLEQLREKFG